MAWTPCLRNNTPECIVVYLITQLFITEYVNSPWILDPPLSPEWLEIIQIINHIKLAHALTRLIGGWFLLLRITVPHFLKKKKSPCCPTCK